MLIFLIVINELITIIIDVTGGRTASYAAITKNVAVKDLNLILKRCYPCKNLSSVNIADSAVSETA